MNPDKLKNIVKFYQEPGFVYPESRNMQLAKRFLQFGAQEFYDEVGSGITGDEPNVVDILREEGISVPNVTKPGYKDGSRVLSPTVQARKEFKGKKFISVADPTYSDGRRRVMTPEYKTYVEELRAKASPTEQKVIRYYNAAKEKLGRPPSIEEVRNAFPGESKPALPVVKKYVEKNVLELTKLRGNVKAAILQAHTDLTKELGKPPTVLAIDNKIQTNEKTKNLSKMKNADLRKSQISEYLKESGKVVAPSPYKTNPILKAQAQAKAAATVRANPFPRKGQPRKTPEDILQRERYKRMEDKKRDPRRTKRAISKKLTDTSLDVHHPFPKREKETLRRLMLLDRDVNRKGVVRQIEERRNELIKEQNILLRRPVKNQRRLQQINAFMRREQEKLRRAGYGGYLGFPISEPGKRKPKYVGFDKSKSLAGLREGEKLLDKDFAKVTKGQKSKVVELSLAKQMKAQGFKCKVTRANGGVASCNNPRAYLDDIAKQREIAKTGSGKQAIKAATKLRGLKTFMTTQLGPAAIAGEIAFAVPFALADYGSGESTSRIINYATFGFTGQSERDEVVKYGGEKAGLAFDADQRAKQLQEIEDQENLFMGPEDSMLYPDQLKGATQRFEKSIQPFVKTDPYLPPGIGERYFDTEMANEAYNKLFKAQDDITRDKEMRQKKRKAEPEDYYGFAAARGGIADVRRPSAIAPESGPTPQGEGLSYLFNRVTDL